MVGANVSGPKGSLDGSQQAYTIAANDHITTAEDYKPITIAYRNGSPVTIGDVTIIIDGLEHEAPAAGMRARQPRLSISSGNRRQRDRGVRQILAEIPRCSPRSGRRQSHIVSDRTVTIRASVRDVQFTLILSVALVILMVLMFLRSMRATIIAGMALPLSLITSFGSCIFRASASTIYR